MKKTILLLIIVAVIVTIIVLKQQKVESERKGSDYEGGESTSSSSSPIGSVLKRGSRGEEVRKLQELFNNYLLTPPLKRLEEDGKFGILTEEGLYMATGRKSITLEQMYILCNTTPSGSILNNLGIGGNYGW